MRRNERSGPGMGNSATDETGSSAGDEIATASDEFVTAELTASPALASKHEQKKTGAIRRDRQRGNFTAGFLLESATPNAMRSTPRRAAISVHPQNRVVPHLRICASRTLIPNSNVGQSNLFSWILQAISLASGEVFLNGRRIGKIESFVKVGL